jgi:DNA-binding IclR family transcriptional regulator
MAADDSQRPHSSAVAVERAADLLFLIAERGEVSLTELARAIGSSGSAVHRILTALKNKGLILQPTDNGPYSLSWSIVALTRRLTSEADMRTISLPWMTSLRDLTDETVTLNVRSGFNRVCIEQAEGIHEVRWHQAIGQISPLYAGASGRTILAYITADELAEFFRTIKPQRITPFTKVSRDEIRKDLETIRKRGYAIGTQDRNVGVAALAAPIFDGDHRIFGALSVAGPTERCSSRQLTKWSEPLMAAAREISEIAEAAAIRNTVTTAASRPAAASRGRAAGSRR